ncbi:MFS transporter [Streptomyces sp. NBC_00038]|uniref:MFS transporter n=1 Tax=Streptomyces sp. NBC_00038 TaxID=2903615 RepID=UPI00225943FE|nr:MFS transporter [Streptomyces sp. NBC_00038]MCX5562907.1 MFS transporter [Streptomyces sp. NBC_00038]
MACMGVFIAYLPVTMVSVSLPAIQQALDASTAELSWVQDAFVLPMAALILTAGVFGDAHGRRKVFLAGLALCAVGAGVSLTAMSVEVLWAGQALAGLGSAALLPTTLALISQTASDYRERARFIGFWAMSLLAALSAGPLIAGGILQHASWRWIYLVPVPVALVSLVVAVWLLPATPSVQGRRLDWPGQITAAVAITALVYGVIEGGAGSFSDTPVVAALMVGVASLIAFVLVERRSADAMLDVTLFRSPGFTATALIAMISFLALIGFFFVFSLYQGSVQQLTTLQAACRLFVIPLAAMVVSGFAGRLMHRVSPRVMIAGGLLVVTASLLLMTSLDADTPFADVTWRLVVLGLGMGCVITPMTAVAVASVPPRQAGMAAAGNNAFRQVGSALGPAVLGVLLTARALDALPGHLATAGLTQAQRAGITETARADGLSAVAEMNLGAASGRVYGALSASMIDGMRLCLLVAAALTLLAAVCALLLLPRPRRNPVGGGSGTGPGEVAGSPTTTPEVVGARQGAALTEQA